MGDSAADVSSIREILKKRGYSEKAIEEVLKWYGSSPTYAPTTAMSK